MQRRDFLRGAAAGVVGGLGLTLGACTASTAAPAATEAPAQAAEMPVVEWRMGTSWPVSLDTIYGGATVLAERLSELTDGKFKITTFPAGELYPGLEVLQNVQQGTTEAGHTAMYYYVGLNPTWAIATALPFGLTAQQQNSWLYHGGGEAAINKLGAEYGVTCFAAGNTGTQMGGFFRKEITSTADLQGLKMRIPGLGGRVMERLGVVPQTLPAGEIFQSLSTGAIDAAEFVGPYDDEKLGMPDAAQYYYAPGWWEPGPSLHAVVNNEAWAKLPAAYQRFFRVAAWESNANMLAKYDALNNDALERIAAKGIQLRNYPDEVLQAAQKAAFEIYAEFSASTPIFKETFDSWNAFRKKMVLWTQVNELPFSVFVRDNPI
jgi:TRAP-type mannitol/chloroaromatic compound transport system substrate-binding protein